MISDRFVIYCLLPEWFLQNELPQSLNAEWHSVGGSSEGAVYSTMVGLRDYGLDIRFVSEWPSEGVVIAHSRNLPKRRPSNWEQYYIICWQIDHPRCDYANMHIVSNKSMLKDAGISFYDKLLYPGPRFILHFLPELSLIPRDINRGLQFSNIAYLGEPKNLMPDFRTARWQERVNALGLNFYIIDQPRFMGDYRSFDCVLAVRPTEQQIHQKPPSKLWNAWRAGVPAILGPEPGFQDYRKSELDYIEVNNAEEALQALVRLRDDPELRCAMIENGFKRMSECSVDAIINQWKDFIEGPLQKIVNDWFHGPKLKREVFGVARTARMRLRRIRAFLNRK